MNAQPAMTAGLFAQPKPSVKAKYFSPSMLASVLSAKAKTTHQCVPTFAHLAVFQQPKKMQYRST
jgi:hypothetical protein